MHYHAWTIEAIIIAPNLITFSFSVDATISSIQACICMEFLMTVAEIFTKGMEESAANAAEKRARAPTSAQTTQQTTQETAPSQGTMTIHAKLEQPEIVLVADMSKDDTNALFLKVRCCKLLTRFTETGNIFYFFLFFLHSLFIHILTFCTKYYKTYKSFTAYQYI